jgi:hypothetical protein
MCRRNQAQRTRFALQDAILLWRFATILKIVKSEIALLANALSGTHFVFKESALPHLRFLLDRSQLTA